MKTKIKPKPLVMWANYYPLAGWSHPCIHPTLLQAKVTAAGGMKPVRVAVIPLDDVEAIVERANSAFQLDESFGFKESMRAALTAAGIPCLKRG